MVPVDVLAHQAGGMLQSCSILIETVAPDFQRVLSPKKGIFSSEPCRWHSEPCVSNSVRSHCLPFPALYSAEAVAMAKTSGRYRETRWFSFRCVNIFWMLSHHFQAKVEKECAANLLNIIIFFFLVVLMYSLSGRSCYQKISSEAIGVKWNWFGNCGKSA